jgi:uncharacterized membrane protein YgaE (UPF0421/DUF939 family)
VTKKRYIFLCTIELILFSFFYHVVSSSNFDSFSNTLRYFISALGTLLAVVVSFNTLALQNQLKNMPNAMEQLDNQTDKIGQLLKPVINVQETDNNKKENQVQNDYNFSKELEHYYSENIKLFEDAILYFTDALESMFVVAILVKKFYFKFDNID